ncbi:alanyl-tRNA synthetase [Salegentibacter sp. 24]|uniref:alanine--tRNA ligase n=1 Tax=Salegentibacter sp. 24 TaxID=2183986 RepID=UPI001060FA11|nr:alanine--tRNA ligase [Salegentibacter sp. 24]TDN87126.1 alanyl-tRNA synthetase [Salegentibacter sp. 24]
MKSQEIRSQFLEFFKSKSHKIVPSAPMVLKDDPSLMFTNAGMVQFKEYFLGNSEPLNSRITDSQKCLRVSGKHNDLEEVGMDTYHHTMFEMLGNWSFGDYFKEEAINWAWELLTEVFKIAPENLYVSVFEGSKEDKLELDTEALELWKKIVPEDRIVYGDKKDNFWEMGDQGPCGPCSEIHIDIRSEAEKTKIPGKELVNADHPQVVEIWNLVFMQYNRKADGSLVELPAKHIDTGMGFERLCMVLQGTVSNYDTDVFTPLISELEKITKSTYGKSEKTDIAIRVVADHVRAVTFSIADGQLPSNTGAGYVIRRILRRAIRYGFTFLEIKEPFIYKLVEVLSKQMGEAYPELISQKGLCENVIREEEQSFLRTLDQGLILLENIISDTQGEIVSGKKAFELYDTFGFPIDLTALILRERGLDLDQKEFEVQLKEQKARSRAATQVTAGDWEEINPMDEEAFVGYDQLVTESKIARYRKVESKKGTSYQIVLTQTPFYPEGGGQVGDRGFLQDNDSNQIEVFDTKKENNLIVHFTKSLPKNLKADFRAVVNAKNRAASAANHTATHLLHQALREVLGTHVEQKGSLVKGDYLRFDFSHFSKVSREELDRIEKMVNTRIDEQLPLIEQRNIPFKDAVDQGALALFGEKYGESVRAIRFGESMELCGGTHVQNTSEIWYFKIISEAAVASGIRRIEAITGDRVKSYFATQDEILEQIKAELKNAKDPVKAVSNLQEENTGLKKQVEALLRDKAKSLKSELKTEISEINGVKFLAKKIDLDAGGIKDLAFQLGDEFENLFLLFATEHNGKALLSCYISKELAKEKNLHAGNIVKELGKYIQGGGGGQAFFATAGGKKPEGINEALREAASYIK